MSLDAQVMDLIVLLLWIAGVVFGLFAFVESVVSEEIKKRLTEALRSNAHALDELPSIAANLFERVFGRSHFSLRCLGASVAASLISLVLLLILRALLIVLLYNMDATKYLSDEIRYISLEEVRTSLGISIAANLVLDYFGLLKTRLIISFLLRRKNAVVSGLLIVVADLIISLLIFQGFYFVFYLIGLFISLSSGKMLLPAGDAYSFMPMLEAMIIFRFATHQGYPSGTTLNFLGHSHAVSIFLLVTLLPIFLVSVFFYASIAPSIWLWLFLLAAMVSRFVAPFWPSALEVLNFEKAPIKMLGLVASAIAIVLVSFGLAMLSLMLTTLSAILAH